MNHPKFAARYTKGLIQQEAQIQPLFDSYIKRTTPTKRRVNGKIAVFMPLLRFPGTMYDAYLKHEDTVRVTFGMPEPSDKSSKSTVFRLEPFIRAKDPQLPAILAKASQLLARQKGHPIFGHPFFKEKLMADIVRAVGVINGINRLFEEHSISAVVLGATNEAAGRALAILASRRRIPSLVTQHGMIGNEFGFLPVFASKLAVHGYDEQNFYMNKGVSKKDIFITGHPRFDGMTTKVPLPRETVLRQAGADPSKKVVVVATNQIRDMSAWSTYIEALMRYPDVSVIIKPHRNEVVNQKLAGYEQLCRKYARVKLLKTNDVKLQNLLPNADAVAVELSTVGLEAMISRVPTVFLRKDDYSAINHRYYYEKMGEFVQTDAARLAKLTYAVMKNATVRAQNQKRINQFMRHAYPVCLSGEAISRILGRLTGKVVRHLTARNYEGRLVKGTAPEIYYVRGGVKRHVVSRGAMQANGFSPKSVQRVPDELLKTIPPGPLLR